MSTPAAVPSIHRPDGEARAAARYRMVGLMHSLAVDGCGGVRHEDPMPGYQTLTRTRIEPATAALQAAVWLAAVARQLVVDAAEGARGAGCSWEQVGRVLGLTEDDAVDSIAEAAYAHLVMDEPRPRTTSRYDPVYAYWRCGSCGQFVTDAGPHDAHPENVEQGHAETCERHRAEVAAYLGEAGAAAVARS